MTLDQLAALLDQLKRPIEEAPRDGTPILGMSATNVTFKIWWSDTWQDWMFEQVRVGFTPTHFLPIPKPGHVEFEVVPKGNAERSYLRGLETGAEVQRLEGEAE